MLQKLFLPRLPKHPQDNQPLIKIAIAIAPTLTLKLTLAVKKNKKPNPHNSLKHRLNKKLQMQDFALYEELLYL